MSLITLTTDFGPGEYVAQMKGVILSLLPGTTIVDVSHDIGPGDVLEAAYVAEVAIPAFPADSVHVVVVDPGVGTDRRALAVRFAGRTIIGPDNGCLTAFLNGPVTAHEIANEGLFLPEVSPTFHGRDVFAPVAAHLAAERPLADVGPKFPGEPIRLPDLVGEGEEGIVLHVDRFGNLITNIPADRIGETAGMTVAGRAVTETATTFGAAPAGTPFFYAGSGGRIEIAVRDGSAAAALGCETGARVTRESTT